MEYFQQEQVHGTGWFEDKIHPYNFIKYFCFALHIWSNSKHTNVKLSAFTLPQKFCIIFAWKSPKYIQHKLTIATLRCKHTCRHVRKSIFTRYLFCWCLCLILGCIIYLLQYILLRYLIQCFSKCKSLIEGAMNYRV